MNEKKLQKKSIKKTKVTKREYLCGKVAKNDNWIS